MFSPFASFNSLSSGHQYLTSQYVGGPCLEIHGLSESLHELPKDN